MFLRRSNQYLDADNLGLLYKAVIRSLLEYNSHIWAGATPASTMFVDRIQKKAFKVINSNLVTDSIDSLEHRRTVWALSLPLFSKVFSCGFYFKKIVNIMPGLLILL